MKYISIIIPMYNESRYVWRCLDSLLLQTYKDFELIMIDDGSIDNTIQIVETYNNKFQSLKILKQNHGWPWKARNRWASLANGKILVFVDADMMFDKHYLEKLVQPIIDQKEIGTAHGWEYVANKNNPIARAFSLIRLSYNSKNPRSWVFRAISKEIFLKSGWFDTSKGYSDDDLTKKVWLSLSIPWAIAYHNNPEWFWEIVKHSQRVGASLLKSWEIQNYISKYKLWVLVFILWCLALFYWFGFLNGLLGGTLLLCSLIIIKWIQRTIQEQYLSHLLYVPIVMFCRWYGYIKGWLSYLFTKKIY